MPTGSASGFFVVDKDVKDGKNGIHDMHRLEEANGQLPQTPQSQTPTGGEHDFYRMPDEEIRNSVGVIAPGIDIRGDGGYVIVPPSTLSDGSSYRWLHEPSEQVEFADAPHWLIILAREANSKTREDKTAHNGLNGHAHGQAARPLHQSDPRANAYLDTTIEEECRAIIAAGPGSQERTLNAAALKLGGLAEGLGLHSRSDEVRARLVSAGLQMTSHRASEPWLRRDIEAKVDRAFTDGMRQPRQVDFNERQGNGHAHGNFAAQQRAGHNPAVELTQNFLARAFVVENKHRIRYDWYRGKWYIFDTTRNVWRCDETGRILAEVRCFCTSHDNPHSPKLGRANTIRGIEDLARSDIEIAVTSSDWDMHPYMLGTPDAYIDLKTGSVSPPDAGKMITQSTIVPVEEGEPELWLRFLYEATGGNAEYVDFIQRVLGNCLTGDVKEHALFFIYGEGGTGKSTLVNAVQEILGSYAWTAPMSMFAEKAFEGHPSELAKLRGRRFVTATETERGRAWAEARIKQLTGGDTIAARFMHRDWFEFKPTHKLVIVGNHAPSIESSGNDMRRRFHVLPFEHKPHEIDQDLRVKLLREAGKILGWMIRGALQWQQRGLDPPPVVQAATEAYFETQDVIGEWLESETWQGPDFKDASSSIHRSYATFMKNLGERALSAKGLGDELRRRGFKRTKISVDGRQHKGWTGLKVIG